MNIIIILFFSSAIAQKNNFTFPANFKLGVSTAAYQIEGAWNKYGKGESIWDDLTHHHQNQIKDRSNGDVACDSYHRYMEDIELMKILGAETYRFSISWPRILPTGYSNKVNPAGIKYYNDLIDALLKEGIEPSVTMYHWDLPLNLQKIGGWVNPNLADIFLDYARILFETYGDRVKIWTTINEPEQICLNGYDTATKAPLISNPGIGGYLCGHTLILAHARVWRMYNKEYRHKQHGKLSMALNSHWFGPKNSNNSSDIEAATRRFEFLFGWWVDPLHFGDYPESMKKNIALQSKHQGFARSRLPVFTPEEKNLIKGTLDYIGLNSYTARLCSDNFKLSNTPSVNTDHGVREQPGTNWPRTNSSWLYITPFALRNILKTIDIRYNKPEVIVTENGMSEHAMNDTDKIKYYNGYLTALLESIHIDKVNVTSYTAWTLMDNFEWMVGFTERFGLVHVDFKSPNKTRTPRASFYNYKKIIETRQVTNLEFEDENDILFNNYEVIQN